MIKKLIVAATFGGSMVVGIPAASAGPLQCSQALNAALAQCQSGDVGAQIGCENRVYFDYTPMPPAGGRGPLLRSKARSLREAGLSSFQGLGVRSRYGPPRSLASARVSTLVTF